MPDNDATHLIRLVLNFLYAHASHSARRKKTFLKPETTVYFSETHSAE